MEINPEGENANLFDSYLNRELSDKELLEFKKKLESDIEFAYKLEKYTTTQVVLENYALREEIRSTLTSMKLEKQHDSVDYTIIPLRIPRRRNWMRIAASVALLFVTFTAYQYFSITNNKLYDEEFKPYKLATERSETNASNSIETAYLNNNYYSTIKSFEQSTNHATKEYFLAGNAYLEEKKIDKAIQCFEYILSHPEGKQQFYEDAEFYLALALLEKNEPQKALAILEKINLDKNHLYHEKVNNWFLLKVKIVQLKHS
ncbi:hypothetical protein NF867_07000 [Solitalea sp. MAHUQ-68]|uniref:Tetratricopeptide repeat-containing protein n=1 Tax=Solitalea agri TaxID=2953739 RepID=A0A9X2F0X4_9SPHI|nr:hypothetical protein [Solitalea agri]MCO4292602.1 hypothetical protein [Solitalea agri]